MLFKKFALPPVVLAVVLATGCHKDAAPTAVANAASDTTAAIAAPAPATPDANQNGDAQQAPAASVNYAQQPATVAPQQQSGDGLTRVHFDDLFAHNADGSFSPKVPVAINGVTMGPGISFGRGVLFGGVDLASYAGRDFAARQLANGAYSLERVYN
ncbi:hypothetical protein [Trinickia sp. EG282A]|uniref:hypothetical protein n=1 Tax=Trinickia sp. EG282A TaxID=3237013 RepID=UPI0034D1DFA5